MVEESNVIQIIIIYNFNFFIKILYFLRQLYLKIYLMFHKGWYGWQCCGTNPRCVGGRCF